jgi:hypothetical protein
LQIETRRAWVLRGGFALSRPDARHQVTFPNDANQQLFRGSGRHKVQKGQTVGKWVKRLIAISGRNYILQFVKSDFFWK